MLFCEVCTRILNFWRSAEAQDGSSPRLRTFCFAMCFPESFLIQCSKMAAAVFPTSNDDRAITILEKGIIIEEDAVVGAWVDQFDKLGLSLHSIEGAKLCRQALEDAVCLPLS